MLVGATQIIGGVSGLHLDPSYVIRSQKEELSGYILVVYHPKSAPEDAEAQRFLDILLFHGSEIIDSTRMNQDLRFHIHHDDVFRTFNDQGRNETTMVSLWQATLDLLQLFRSTIYFEPSIKTQLRGLSKKHLSKLLNQSSCSRGIIECNDLASNNPSISLSPIASADELARYQPPFRNGRLLLYDTVRNRQLVNDRFSSISAPITGVPSHELDTARPRLEILDSTRHKDQSADEPILDEREAQDLIDTINRILNSPADTHQPNDSTGTPIIITQSPAEDSLPRQTRETSDAQTQKETATPPKRTPRKKSLARKPEDPPPVDSPETPARQKVDPPPPSDQEESAPQCSSQAPPASTVDTPAPVDDASYIRLFERLFRSFRQQLFDSYGDKTESVISDSESRVRFLSPEFDLRSLDVDTAIAVLDLIESIIDTAPFFKRGKLKEAAVTLVADLYNKQYEVLEQRRAIERVEQFYYKLKRQ